MPGLGVDGGTWPAKRVGGGWGVWEGLEELREHMISLSFS